MEDTILGGHLAVSDLDGRHPGVTAILRHFEFGHPPEHLQAISAESAKLAASMVKKLPDGPELTTGLRKLLEAKDCFVRAHLEGH
jgi:hypothetical protein